MLEKWNRNKLISILIYGCIFAVMFVCNILTPYLVDDFFYYFSFATGEPLTSVLDIFPSMLAHASIMNGRLSAHFLVQLFMLFPKIVFDLVNAGMFCLLVWLITTYASSRRNNLLTIAVFCTIWLYEPAFSQVNMWQDGAVNYLWSAVVVLLYLRPFVKMYREDTVLIQKTFSKVLFLLFSFFAGSYSETGSAAAVGMAFLLCAVTVWKGTCKIDWYAVLAVIVTMLGYISIYLAPAQWVNKSANMSVFVLFGNLEIATRMYQSFGVLVAATVILLIINFYIKTSLKTITVAGILIIGSLAANYIMIFAGYYAERSTVCAFIFLVTAWTILLPTVLKNEQWQPKVVCALVVLMLATIPAFLTGMREIATTYIELRQNEKVICENRDNGIMHIEIPMVYSDSKYSQVYYMKYLDEDDARSWPNETMAMYYGVESILGVDP